LRFAAAARRHRVHRRNRRTRRAHSGGGRRQAVAARRRARRHRQRPPRRPGRPHRHAPWRSGAVRHPDRRRTHDRARNRAHPPGVRGMTEYVLLVPTGAGVGLTTVTLGLLRAFERQGTYVAFVKPIGQTRNHDSLPERSTALVRATTTLHPPEPMTLQTVEEALRRRQEQRLLEDIVGRVHGAAVDPEVVVIEGLVPSEDVPFGDQINAEIATALDARVIVVGSAKGATPASLVDALSLAAAGFRREQIA